MQKQVLAALVVKKHPDGYHYVPFDHDPHPDRQRIIEAYMDHLTETGHTFSWVAGSHHRPPNMRHPDDFHLRLHTGPHSHLGAQDNEQKAPQL